MYGALCRVYVSSRPCMLVDMGSKVQEKSAHISFREKLRGWSSLTIFLKVYFILTRSVQRFEINMYPTDVHIQLSTCTLYTSLKHSKNGKCDKRACGSNRCFTSRPLLFGCCRASFVFFYSMFDVKHGLGHDTQHQTKYCCFLVIH